jgi:hypothetical protein
MGGEAGACQAHPRALLACFEPHAESACRSEKAMLMARLHRAEAPSAVRQSGRSSGVEHNLAKVGVEGSNPFARSSFFTSMVAMARLRAICGVAGNETFGRFVCTE